MNVGQMKILVTANYYPEKVGGIEIVAHNLVSRFRKSGHDVRWVAADVHDRRRVRREGDHPIKAWNFTEKRLGFPYPLPHPAALNATRKHVNWADVIHIHDSLYLHNQYIFWQARRLRKPVILTQHNRGEIQRTRDSPLLLFVGRFTQKKGLALIREVAAARPEWAWTLVGTPGEIDPAAWGLDNVNVLPPCAQSELRKLYRSANLLALPSVGEGFPLVIAGMGCGTPVLIGPETAAALPGLKDCVAVAELTTSGLLRTIEGIVSDRTQEWDGQGASCRFTAIDHRQHPSRGGGTAHENARSQLCQWLSVASGFYEPVFLLSVAALR